METIIGLLFILLPVLLKLVEKKLKTSGQQVPSESLDEVEEETPFFDIKELFPEEKPKVVPKKEEIVVNPDAPKPKKVILLEEEPVKREKIDPKKLVIYSEIMKPKFKTK